LCLASQEYRVGCSGLVNPNDRVGQEGVKREVGPRWHVNRRRLNADTAPATVGGIAGDEPSESYVSGVVTCKGDRRSIPNRESGDRPNAIDDGFVKRRAIRAGSQFVC